MVGDLLADGPEQQAPKAAEAAGADDQEIRSLRLAKELVCRVPLAGELLDADARRELLDPRDRVSHDLLGRLVEARDQVDRRRDASGIDGSRNVIRAYHPERGASQHRFLGREAKRGFASPRAVDTDDDDGHDASFPASTGSSTFCESWTSRAA